MHGQEEKFNLDPESPLAISQSLWGDLTSSKEDLPNLFESTPAKDCLESKLSPTAKQGRDYDNPFSKRRRMLNFCTSVSNKCGDSGDDALQDGVTYTGMQQDSGMNRQCSCVASSTGKKTEQRLEMHLEGFTNMIEAHDKINEVNEEVPFDDQIDISEFCPLEAPDLEDDHQHEPHMKDLILTKKSNYDPMIRFVAPAAYPFALLKPCGEEGDVTLSYINQQISLSQKSLVHGTYSKYCDGKIQSKALRSASFGKAVVTLRRIHTEGNGSITILKTTG